MDGRAGGCRPRPRACAPELASAGREAWARRRQRLALLEAALPGQGTLLLLVFPLLVLLLLFLNLANTEESGERGAVVSGAALLRRAPVPSPRGHLPARPRAGGGPGRGCPQCWACGDPRAPRQGRSDARFAGRCTTASGGWRRPSAGTRARLQRDERGLGAFLRRGWPLPRPSCGFAQGRRPYPGPGHCGAVLLHCDSVPGRKGWASSDGPRCCSPMRSAAGCDLEGQYQKAVTAEGHSRQRHRETSRCQAQRVSPRRTLLPIMWGHTYLPWGLTSTADPGNKTLPRAMCTLLEGALLPLSQVKGL